jgi:hypothetical protein
MPTLWSEPLKGRFVIELVVASLVLTGCASNKPRPSVPDHPIEDHPVRLDGVALDEGERAMAALITESQAELPRVRKRFEAGLGADEVLYLVVRLFHPDRSFEQAFVRVTEWTPSGITGVIASELMGFTEPKRGDVLGFAESTAIDWTITGPGGTEEGNRLGHYLEYRGQKP